MRRYRKRPVEVEAIQFTGSTENVAEILAEVGERAAYINAPPQATGGNGYIVIDHPREGKMIVERYDWIIKNKRGEFYPCERDAFERIYERAS